MKKFILAVALLLGLSAATVSLNAQNYEQNIFGVRAGMNISSAKVSAYGLSLEGTSKAGFVVGADYQRLLLNDLPLYAETGLGLAMTNFGFDGDISLFQLQVPIMLNYKFFYNDLCFYPSAGLVYSFAVSGKYKYSYEGMTYSENLFDGDSTAKRSNIGFRLGASANYKSLSLGLSYTIGLTSLFDYKDEYGSSNMKSNAFMITLGYNF